MLQRMASRVDLDIGLRTRDRLANARSERLEGLGGNGGKPRHDVQPLSANPGRRVKGTDRIAFWTLLPVELSPYCLSPSEAHENSPALGY